MKLAALCSGGKDSTFSIYRALRNGHTIECMVTIYPITDDSIVFHYPNIRIAKSVADAMQIPFVGVDSSNTLSSKKAECEVLGRAIMEVKSKYGVEGIIHGTISSRFQNEIFRKICSEYDLISITPIWNIRPYDYLHTLINTGFHIKITSVSAMGLDYSWLGKDLTLEAIDKLHMLSRRHGINISFEGGEAETLTIDCPIFKKRISIKKFRRDWDGQRGIFEILEYALIPKD